MIYNIFIIYIFFDKVKKDEYYKEIVSERDTFTRYTSEAT